MHLVAVEVAAAEVKEDLAEIQVVEIKDVVVQIVNHLLMDKMQLQILAMEAVAEITLMVAMVDQEL
jgi:hypothetical protein